MHPPSEVIADPQGAGGGPLRVGRRFGRTPGDFSHRQAAFERSKSVFGRLHQKKMSRLQYQEKMRRGERQAKIALTRSYRAGDLPDIKINSADLVSCLRNLCYRDSHTAVSVARMLLSGMYILLPLSIFFSNAVWAVLFDFYGKKHCFFIISLISCLAYSNEIQWLWDQKNVPLFTIYLLPNLLLHELTHKKI